jgi:hypothetical protein
MAALLKLSGEPMLGVHVIRYERSMVEYCTVV